METDDMLVELLAMQKETNDRNTRMEVQLSSFESYKDALEKRVAKQEELLEKLGNIIAQHEKIAEVVVNINNALDKQNNRFDKLEEEVELLNAKIAKLEMAPAKKAYDIVHKVVWIVIPLFITALCSWIMVKMGLSFK